MFNVLHSLHWIYHEPKKYHALRTKIVPFHFLENPGNSLRNIYFQKFPVNICANVQIHHIHNKRPFFIHIRAEHVINWDSRKHLHSHHKRARPSLNLNHFFRLNDIFISAFFFLAPFTSTLTLHSLIPCVRLAHPVRIRICIGMYTAPHGSLYVCLMTYSTYVTHIRHTYLYERTRKKIKIGSVLSVVPVLSLLSALLVLGLASDTEVTTSAERVRARKVFWSFWIDFVNAYWARWRKWSTFSIVTKIRSK